jgi:hypothetical protein
MGAAGMLTSMMGGGGGGGGGGSMPSLSAPSSATSKLDATQTVNFGSVNNNTPSAGSSWTLPLTLIGLAAVAAMVFIYGRK